MRFNPRTHMGCDLSNSFAPGTIAWFQSTHPHGVRRYFGGILRDRPVSIHAPTWGATRQTVQAVGCHRVSIHAPTWGATLGPVSAGGRGWFQSTHPHGVRRGRAYSDVTVVEFQSTHPHGVRLTRKSSVLRTWGFNPRTHMGCDPRLSPHRSATACFNPRTHMGCDCQIGHGRNIGDWFQSTHPHGVRPRCWS